MHFEGHRIKTLFWVMVFCLNSIVPCLAQNISGQDPGAVLKRYIHDKRHDELEERLHARLDMRPALDAPAIQKTSIGTDRFVVSDIFINHNIPDFMDVDFDAIATLIEAYKGRTVGFEELDQLCLMIAEIIDSPTSLVYIPEQTRISEQLFINVRISE